MYEQPLTKENDRKLFFDTLTRKSALVVALCSLPFFLFAYLGDPGRGRTAAICAFVIGTTSRAFWDLRKHVWFWITMSILVVAHVPLVLLIPWSSKSYPGMVLLPVALLDFAIVYGCIISVEKVMKGINGVNSAG